MSFKHWLSSRFSPASRTGQPASRRQARPAQRTFRPTLESLEDRWLPSNLTVTSIADKGARSLRADIAAAKNGDTIVFASSLDGQTITLKSELLINKNLTITGPGAGQLTVSGHNSSRVFEVASGMQVSLSGLTISNGFAVNGAGILVDTGAVLAVSNSTLSGNSASKSQRYVGNFGGGIDNYGTATVSNCTLTNNTSLAGGGGIYNHATLTVSNNSAVSGNNDVGIANISMATITGSTLSDNSGSGIYNFALATVTVSDSFLSDNSSYGDGGGIYNVGAATIGNCTLSGNSAPEYGGGIYSAGNGSTGNARLTVTGCTLSGNFCAHGSGGGIYISAVTATISGCTLSGNSAYGDGGGIYFYGGFGSTLTISGSTLSGNSAQYGGGVYNSATGTVTAENSSSITGNTAPGGFGADVYNQGVLYLDSASTIGILDGNPALPI
jgi:predicted outer membrane repeat protein/parallel beta-helix repeat protein